MDGRMDGQCFIPTVLKHTI